MATQLKTPLLAFVFLLSHSLISSVGASETWPPFSGDRAAAPCVTSLHALCFSALPSPDGDVSPSWSFGDARPPAAAAAALQHDEEEEVGRSEAAVETSGTL